jgi:carbamoyl-phosphate synthase large subunit
MSSFNILFASAGRRVSLIQCFRHALCSLGLHGLIITSDMKQNVPAAFTGDAHVLTPPASHAEYIPALEDVCRRYEIRMLIPLTDVELGTLAGNKERFRSLGVEVMAGSTETNGICLDKRATCQFFKRIGVATPDIMEPAELLASDETRYPLILKPANGSSSLGVTLIRDRDELAFFAPRTRDAIVQRVVAGQEYTLDILVDFQGQARCVVPRMRIETRAGEVSKALTRKHPELIRQGKFVADALPGARGCITAQAFLGASEEITFIEINPRFGGGFPLAARAGADFPRWMIEMCLGRTSAIAVDGWQDGLAMLRYDEAVFVGKERLS